jgi:predicted transglutaminase-like cysteine proteinase
MPLEEPLFARHIHKTRISRADLPGAGVFLRIALAAVLAGAVFFCAGGLGAAEGGLTFDKPPVDLDWGAVPDAAQMLAPDGARAPGREAPQPLQTPPGQAGGGISAGNAPDAAPAESPARAPTGGAPAAKWADRLFGTVEFRSKLKDLPKWERVVRAWAGKSGIDDAFGPSRQREAQAWQQIKAKAAGSGALEKTRAVNAFFNQWPYRLDKDVYGVSDYWATPAEFIKNSGDCEDYAITKMYALKQLGVKAEHLRIVALKDNIRNLDHAVLAVYIEGTIYILDNVTKLVLTHDKFQHYRPYFSVNAVYKWTHIPPK